MSNAQTQGRQARGRGLWLYNLRILLGNTYWLIVTPVAVAQLVLFWNMATASLFSPVRAAQTVELVAPLLGAFLCAHALAPEQAGVRELVFARPVSLEKILLVRLSAMFAFVLAVMAPALLLYHLGIKSFPLGLTLLAGLPSLLFLSMLAMLVATATQIPMLGLVAAGVYWALDSSLGGLLNPLVTLHGFADGLVSQHFSRHWVASKFILLGLAGAFYLWNRRLLSLPAGPRRWVTALRVGLAILISLFGYLGTGATYKLVQGLRSERRAPGRSYFYYRQQFQTYGPLPIPRLFGPAFGLFVQANSGRGASFSWVSLTQPTPGELANMKRLVELYPSSIWADNAAFEIARATAQEMARRPWSVTIWQTGAHRPEVSVIQENLEGGMKAYSRFAESYPKSPFTPLALGRAATMAVTLLDFRTAIGSYERLLRDYPSSPEACDAGLALSRLYLGESRWKEALKAADIAAAAATWELKGEALLAAARAAERGGDRTATRGRYQKALAAAKEARHLATEHKRRSDRGLTGGGIALRCDNVMRVCEQALARDSRDFIPPPSATGTTVTGRIVRAGKGVEGVRVVLATALDAGRQVTPFTESAVAHAITDSNGVYQLQSVQPGEYHVLVFASRQDQRSSSWMFRNPALPVQVGASPLALPEQVMIPRPKPPPPASVAPGAPFGATNRAGALGRSGRRASPLAGPLQRRGGEPSRNSRYGARPGARPLGRRSAGRG